MNIHNVHLLLIGGLLFLLTGCMDLEREDFTEIYPDNFFKTETDLKLAVDGRYDNRCYVVQLGLAIR